MGIVLAARPAALLGVIYKPEYGAGAAAMPILVGGECCLALLGGRLRDPERRRADARDALVRRR